MSTVNVHNESQSPWKQFWNSLDTLVIASAAAFALWVVLSTIATSCESYQRHQHEERMACIEAGGAWSGEIDACVWSKAFTP